MPHLGRLLAFELLTEGKDELATELIPGMVDDPSLPLRYKSIKHLIEKSEGMDQQMAIGALGFALDNARDVEQVQKIAELLSDKGVSIDLQQQLGFLTQWNLVGNFDNKNQKGFDVAYGPEKDLANIDLAISYQDVAKSDDDEAESGKAGQWIPYNSLDSAGLVDLNKVIGKVKGVSAYAHATYDSDVDQAVDIRIGCINAHKIWVNGELVMSNEIYHNSTSIDKFIARANLKKGSNEVLIKVCQNEQTQSWAQRWQFQVRICDETGRAIRPSNPAADPAAAN